MTDLILINHLRDFSAYANCNPVLFDKLPSTEAVKSFVAGLVGGGAEVRFSQLDSDWSDPVATADELETGTPALIAGGEESDVQYGIVAQVVKKEYQKWNKETAQYDDLVKYKCKYWVVRE